MGMEGFWGHVGEYFHPQGALGWLPRSTWWHQPLEKPFPRSTKNVLNSGFRGLLAGCQGILQSSQGLGTISSTACRRERKAREEGLPDVK